MSSSNSGDPSKEASVKSPEVLDHYNPMMTEYLSPKNAYENLEPSQQPYVKANLKLLEEKGLIDEDSALMTSTKPYKLHIYNIDPDINEQGIRNCFSKFGKILDIDFCQRKNFNGKVWANIAFSTQMEAQSALQELNDAPPYRFKIKPALTDAERAKRKEQYAEDFHDPLKEERDRFYRTKGIGQRSDLIGSSRANRLTALALCSARVILPNNPFRGQKLYDASFSSDQNEEDQSVPNSLISSIDPDMLQPKIFGYPLIYEWSPPGECRSCKESGRLRCSQCKAWYCSLKCQENHWQIHRLECEPIPQLETESGLPAPRAVNTGWKPSSSPSSPRKNPVRPNQEEPKKSEVKEEKKMKTPKSTKSEIEKPNAQEEAQIVPKCNETEHHVTDQPVHQGKDLYRKAKLQETKKIGENLKIGARCIQSDPMKEKVSEILKNKVEVPVQSPSSILDSIEPGVYEFLTEPEKSALEFCGMINFKEVASYILDVFQEEIKSDLNKLINVKVGNFVVFRQMEDGSEVFYRGFVVDQNKEKNVCSLVNIDFASKVEVKLEDLFEIPSKVLAYSTLGIKMTTNQKVKPEMQKVISNILLEETVAIKITDEKRDTNRRSTQIKAILCGGKSTGEVMSYLANSWTSVDPKIPALLGIEDPKMLRKNFKELQLKDGSSVIILEHGVTTNTIIVQTEESVEKSKKLEELLETQLSLEQVPVTNLIVGEMVACKWSESDLDCFYRAEITAIDSQRKKVKVSFVDYGNQAVESLDNVTKLPDVAADPEIYPICAQILTLSDVPKLQTKSVQIQLNHLKPQLTLPFKVKFSDDKATVQLFHANGETLNKMVKHKLQEPPSHMAMEGQVLGRGFEYDRCHIAQLPIKPDMVQNALLLCPAESPKKVFFASPDQIALASTIEEQCMAYSKVEVESSIPPYGCVCVAKGSDESWYRGVVLDEIDDSSFMIFFPDFGFKEIVLHINIRRMTGELMETPFLANHCIVENFEQVTDETVLDKATKLLKKLEDSSEIEIITLSKDKDSLYTIRIPCIAKELEAIIASVKRDNKIEKKHLEEEELRKKQLLKEEELRKKQLKKQLLEEELKKKRVEEEEVKKKQLQEQEMKKKQLQEEEELKKQLLEKKEAKRQIKELEEKLALLKQKI